jgi:hypothetical protein
MATLATLASLADTPFMVAIVLLVVPQTMLCMIQFFYSTGFD